MKNSIYEYPKNSFNTGDIWKGLPSFMMLNQDICSGVIITPNCDLSNFKSDTITYLPIISLQSYFCSRSFYPEMRRKLVEALNQTKIKFQESELPKSNLPNQSFIAALEIEVNNLLVTPTSKNHQIKALETIGLIKNIIYRSRPDNIILVLKKIYGEKEFKDLKKTIITNSYRPDMHFFPKDFLEKEVSAVTSHSVCLFRCPITIPLDLLNYASDISIVEWNIAIEYLGDSYPIVKELMTRPLKCLHLKNDYLGDLLTRYLSLYIRFGSPDFNAKEIEKLSNEIDLL